MPYDVALIKEIKQLDKDIWIDGRVEDQFIWNTTVPRVNNFANPNNIVDYSKERSWVESLRAAGTLVENEEKGLKFQFHQALCEDNLEFRVWGNFSSKRLDVNRPVIKAIVDKNNIAFRWVFYKGGVIGDDADETDAFTVNAVVDGQQTPVVEVPLPGLDLKNHLNFTLVLDCPKEGSNRYFDITMNDEWTGRVKFNDSWVPGIHTLQLAGGIETGTAAYMGDPEKSCLLLTKNGRVEPKYDGDCDQSLPTVCEHQFCYTRDGFQCIFPFTYKGIVYKNCSSQDLFKPWCPTTLDSAGEILEWGFCLEDCPFEEPAPSCIDPPPVPSFATPGTDEVL